jgi:NitT/TauT family transport system substrate-binding protein
MMAYVGIDPRKDVNWITRKTIVAMELFAEGKADAFMGFVLQPQELRARKSGHVIVNMTQGRPWSRYFCWMVGVRREFAAACPVATKVPARERALTFHIAKICEQGGHAQACLERANNRMDTA